MDFGCRVMWKFGGSVSGFGGEVSKGLGFDLCIKRPLTLSPYLVKLSEYVVVVVPPKEAKGYLLYL